VPTLVEKEKIQKSKAAIPLSNPQEAESTVIEDQRDRGYYYDDSHGYEKFDPELSEPEEDVETTAGNE
jgi:hypothetical protein